MKYLHLCFVLALLSIGGAYGQAFDKFKLTENEIPDTYKLTDKLFHKSLQAINFYKEVEIYEDLIGSVKSKDMQSYKSKKDSGTIFYFYFENKFEAVSFLEGLLWDGDKPTKSHPEEFTAKGNVLIIWSCNKKSELKQISKDKVVRNLKSSFPISKQ